MPCTLEPWEIAFEEKRANKDTFGRELTDAALLEQVACDACRTLMDIGKMTEAPELVRKWARLHRIKDGKSGRKWK